MLSAGSNSARQQNFVRSLYRSSIWFVSRANRSLISRSFGPDAMNATHDFSSAAVFSVDGGGGWGVTGTGSVEVPH